MQASLGVRAAALSLLLLFGLVGVWYLATVSVKGSTSVGDLIVNGSLKSLGNKSLDLTGHDHGETAQISGLSGLSRLSRAEIERVGGIPQHQGRG